MGYAMICPLCKGKFKWNPIEGWPDQCPLCHEFVGQTRPPDEVVVPFIRLTGATKATDELYRAIEKGSEHRIEAAAEMSGGDKSDFASLKITDLASTKHEGDVAAKPVVNELTQHMAARNWQPFQNSAQVAEYAAGTKAGPHPHAGVRYGLNSVQKHHKGF